MKLKQVVSYVSGWGLAFLGGVWSQAQLPMTLTPNSNSSAETQAQVLLEAGRYHDAEEILRNDLKENDHSATAHATLAYILLRENKPRESLEEYTRSAAIEKPTAEILERVGQDYVLLEDWTDADIWTLRAVKMSPTDGDAWYSLGRIRFNEQRFTDALACFQRVLKLSPESVKAENNLGLTYEALDQTDTAVTAYRQAIAWQNNGTEATHSEQPLLNLSIILLHRGQESEAEPLLIEAAKIAPKDPRIHEQLGHLYLQKADYPAALREFQQACEADSKNAGLHFMMGQVYRRLGEQEKAKEEFAISARLGDATRR